MGSVVKKEKGELNCKQGNRKGLEYDVKIPRSEGSKYRGAL